MQVEQQEAPVMITFTPRLVEDGFKKVNLSHADDDCVSTCSSLTVSTVSSFSSSPASSVTSATRRLRRQERRNQMEDAIWDLQKMQLSSQQTRQELFGGDDIHQAVKDARSIRKEIRDMVDCHYFIKPRTGRALRRQLQK